ncbi:MAG: hypothetical protein KC479_11790 [Dehalococcoidia bacterium]|nr:hypothetical protein [Dehalococcoidia bacterium]
MLQHAYRALIAAGSVMTLAIIAVAAPFAVHSVVADHDEVTADAGGGETGYAINLFLPKDITIHTGDTVTWDFPWFEPHSVTYGTPTGDPTAPSVPLDEAYAFDGTGYFSSGLLGPGFSDETTFSVTFTMAGDYELYCAIHPFMTGNVSVVDDGDTDTQEEMDTRAAAEYEAELTAAKALGATLAAAPTTSMTNADGSTTYDVVVAGALMGSDVMQFFPPSLTVKEGDSVKFTNNTPVPHTATFNPQLYPGGDPFEVPQSDVSGGFDGTGFTNSGIIGKDFPDGTTFEMKFLTAGTYNYICLLHDTQGMVGSITVEEAPATTPSPSPSPTATSTPTPTATPTATASPTVVAPQPPATGTGSIGDGPGTLALYLGGLALVLFGASALMLARRS